MQQIKVLFAIMVLFLLSCDKNNKSTDPEISDDKSSSVESSSNSSGALSSSSTSSISYGTLIDPRDNHTYKTVVIGTQTWMAENLAYLPSVGDGYYVYDYEGTDVVKAKARIYYTTFGVLYSWREAMALTEPIDSGSVAIQGVCPEGWHLPSGDEWSTIASYLGGNSIAGTKLKSVSGWGIGGSLGTDDYGFSALPGGWGNPGEFQELGYSAHWWTSHTNSYKNPAWNDKDAYKADSWGLHSDTRFYPYNLPMYLGLSVRCVEGQGLAPPSRAITYGSLIDTRDGHTYKTVVIGTQTWMAENLAYLPSINDLYDTSSTIAKYYVSGYNGSSLNEAKASLNYTTLGVAYNWPAAMGGATFTSSSSGTVKDVCPLGWHVPRPVDWGILFGEVSSVYGLLARALTAKSSGGTDTHGFSALPGGGGWPVFGGRSAEWWISGLEMPGMYSIQSVSYDILVFTASLEDRYYVRCVQDQDI